MTLLKVGTIARAHGIRGELIAAILPGRLRDWEGAESVRLGPETPPVSVTSARFHRGRWIVTLEGIADRDAAEALRGREVYVDADERQADGWNTEDWLGFEVSADTGEALGTISEIIHTGANDVVVVAGQGPELLLPVIADVILNLDLPQRKLTVHVLDGLRG